MKKLFKLLMFLTLCALLAAFGFACSNGGNGDAESGLLYKMYPGDDYYTVYGYVAEEGVTELDLGAYNTGDVKIGRIKSGAFKDNDSIKKLIVPDTVETIDAGAFAKMKALEEITLPFIGKTAYADVDYNTTLDVNATKKSIGNEHVFGYVFGTENYEAGVSCEQNSATYYLPSTLTTLNLKPKAGSEYGIPMNAFTGNTWISKITLSEDVKVIGKNAFKDNIYVEDINLSGIETMYDYAFKGAKNIKNADLSALTNMGAECFAGCTSLKEVKVNTDIVPDAFNGCSKLTKVSIEDRVNIIGARAFVGCNAISTVEVLGNNAWNVGLETGVAFNAENVKVATYSVVLWTRA